jgi:hypothetical protein
MLVFFTGYDSCCEEGNRPHSPKDRDSLVYLDEVDCRDCRIALRIRSRRCMIRRVRNVAGSIDLTLTGANRQDSICVKTYM